MCLPSYMWQVFSKPLSHTYFITYNYIVYNLMEFDIINRNPWLKITLINIIQTSE